MAISQFLVRNRHQNIWYGRIIIPTELRRLFYGRRELRRSLKTLDKSVAKRQATALWLNCQHGFDLLSQDREETLKFGKTSDFLDWVGTISVAKKEKPDKTVRKLVKQADRWFYQI